MTPKIVSLHSPDVDDLVLYKPQSDEFGFLLQIMAAPESSAGAESFDVVVCSPQWLTNKTKEANFLVGRHYLIVTKYEYEELAQFIEEYAKTCEGLNWKEVAEKLGRLGRWEFEDYQVQAEPI